MHRNSNCPENVPTRWTDRDWERAWQLVERRVKGMSDRLIIDTQIQQSFTAMDEAFMSGNCKNFEQALIGLMDQCAELVNRGDYQQWW